jgi:hypothetical protein
VEARSRLLTIVDDVDAGFQLMGDYFLDRAKRSLLEQGRIGMLSALPASQEINQLRWTANTTGMRSENAFRTALHVLVCPLEI